MKRFLYILTFLFSALTFAQTEIYVSADTNQALIGDVIRINVKVNNANDIFWPNIEEDIKPLELQLSSSIDTLTKNGSSTYIQDFTIQSFDTGRFILPSLEFINTKGDTFYSDSLSFAFLSVALDTTKAVYDIKAPVAVPFNFEEAKPYIYGLLALIALIIIIYSLIQKMSGKAILKEDIAIVIPCEVTAIKALKKLQRAKLCDKGEVKEHYVRLTEILRTYFDEEFSIETLESTSDETIELLKTANVETVLLDQITALLTEADLVKFAKSNPDSRTNDIFMKQSFIFIKDCRKMKEEGDNV